MKKNYLVTSLVFLLFFSIFSVNSLAWWNSSWVGRKNVTFTENSGKDLTNYNITYWFPHEGKAQADCDDVRPINPSNNEIYFNSTDCNSTHVKLTYPIDVSASSSVDYSIYYDNDGVGVSSEEMLLKNIGVPLDHDSFEDNDIDEWSGTTGSYSVSSSTAFDGTYSLHTTDSGYQIINRSATTFNKRQYEWYFRMDDSNSNNFLRLYDGGTIICETFGSGSGAASKFVVCGDTISWTPSTNTWYHVQYKQIDWENDVIGKVYVDGSLKASNVSFENSADEITKVGVKTGGSSADNYWDFITNGTSVSPEPTYTVGSEQGAPDITIESETPTDPATYSSGQAYKFNATISDAEGDSINVTEFKWNGGSYTEVTTCSWVNSSYGECEYTLPHDLSAGNYTYTWYANDSLGNSNTNQSDYEVKKAPTVLHVAINGTESNQSFLYQNVTNTTAWTDDTDKNGVNLYRNGSSLSNPDIIELGAGVWNYTANFTHENYTNSTTLSRILTIEKKPSGLSLTSSAGWNIQEGVSTEISCSFASYVEENETLKIGDTIVTSPYSFKPSVGTYSVFCGIDNYNYTDPNQTKTLYVNALISCTSNDTFAFSASISTGTDITTLKLTDLVNQSLIREGLGDIYAENVSDIWINKTGGYYAVINNTGLSQFTFKFGNYYINKTYPSRTRENVQNLSSYTQINPYIHYNILNELTGEELYPQNSTITSILTCPSGENYIPVDKGDTTFILAGKEYFDKAVLQVKYTADMYYSRQIYPKEIDSQVINFYVVDAYEHALDRIDFEMVDINYYDSKLIIYKTWGGQDVTITEGYFDASYMFSAYLREDTDYYLKTVNPEGDFGRMTIVQPAKKQLGKAEAQLNPQAVLISDNIMMNAYMNSNRTEMTIEYDDKLNQTNNVTITVYFQNETEWKESTHTSSHVLLTYNTTEWKDESFSVTFSLYHETLNDGEEIKYKMSLMPSTSFGFQFGSSIAQLIALGLLMFIGGITTRRSLIGGSLLFMIGAFLFYGMGWLEVPLVLFGLTIFLFIMGIAIYLKTTGE